MRTGLASLALAIACALCTALPASPLRPEGRRFLRRADPLPGKKHGDVIWSQPLSAKGRLKQASNGRLVLYRSEP